MRHGNTSGYSWSQDARDDRSSAAQYDPRTDIRKAVLFPELASKPIPWLGGGPDTTRETLGAICNAMVGGGDEPFEASPNPTPAGYTYLGQFIFHDMAFSHIFQRQGTKSNPPQAEPGAVASENTFSLDLNSIYGVGPAFDPHLYETPRAAGERCRFLLGKTDPSDSPSTLDSLARASSRDLPRIDTNGPFMDTTGVNGCIEPLISDPRNDDQLILSQLHCTLLRIHNRVVDVLVSRGLQPGYAFESTRRFLTACYRHLVLTDYLKRLLHPLVYDALIGGERSRVFGDVGPKAAPTAEFIFGAARFGHAMVRGHYQINALPGGGEADLGLLLKVSSARSPWRVPVPAHWAIDWTNFFAVGPASGSSPQSARRISPFLAETLARRPLGETGDGTMAAIPFLDMWRCYTLGLPSGQEVAAQVAARLAPPRSKGTAHASGTTGDDARLRILGGPDMLPSKAFAAAYPFSTKNLEEALQHHPSFLTATPLSYYLLQEASILGNAGAHLGPVGSFIIAHTVAQSLGGAGIEARSAEVASMARIATFSDFLALLDPQKVSEGELLSMVQFDGGGEAGRHRRTGTIGS